MKSCCGSFFASKHRRTALAVSDGAIGQKKKGGWKPTETDSDGFKSRGLGKASQQEEIKIHT